MFINMAGLRRFLKLSSLSRQVNKPWQSVTSQRNYYEYSPEPFHPILDKEPAIVSAEDAVKVISSGLALVMSKSNE